MYELSIESNLIYNGNRVGTLIIELRIQDIFII